MAGRLKGRCGTASMMINVTVRETKGSRGSGPRTNRNQEVTINFMQGMIQPNKSYGERPNDRATGDCYLSAGSHPQERAFRFSIRLPRSRLLL
jgi:hypothetical protein